jgi:hypothetical protein
MQRTRNPWRPTVLQLLNGRYEGASAAVAYGSPVRGEDLEYADIDLIVVGDLEGAPLSESIIFGGWPMEIHVHTPATLWEVSERLARTERITRLPHMFTIGEMVFDRDGTGGNLKSRLTDLMVKGPAPMNDSELVLYRHRISDGIADLSDPRPLGEVMFSAAKLARSIAEFVLARNKHWLSTGKALHRNLRQVEPELAERLAEAWSQVGSDPNPLIAVADEVLEPVGGRLFEGATPGY